MKSPSGISVEIGQKWIENDPRLHRIVEVVGIDTVTQQVQIKAHGVTWASLKRFNGKRGGYSWIPEPEQP